MGQLLDIIWANRSTMAQGQQMQEHSHSCHQLYYILGGDPVFIIGGEKVHVHSGSCFLVPAFSPHQMLTLNNEGLQSYELKLIINDPFLKDHLQQFLPPLEDNGILEEMLAYVVENYNCYDAENARNIEYILSALLMRFFIDRVHYENHGSRFILTEGYSSVTRAVLVHIEKNFQRSFSLPALADKLHYSGNYLCTVFKKNTGVSIIDYLNFVRIRQAVIFFAFYGLDVFTVYESTGFRNSSYFSRSFKSLVSISPRDFRRAFSVGTRREVLDCFTQEPILNYHLCSMKEAFLSLKNTGQKAMNLLQK